ncbi:MAG: B12-binding domain-containing radical SAM protein [Planctomycetota bacterium]|jgi:radical SAM superfamily enzyme YgiQ (UPF0313 family)
MADITLVNLNMLFIRYGEETERELHVPLGPLYLTRALEDAGFSVDFRDYQTCDAADPFEMATFLDFMDDPAPVIGLSCMANLLPFSILALKALREKYPDRTLVLGGVGGTSVEEQILSRFPWVDIICRGEGELTGPHLLQTLRDGGKLANVNGISFHRNGAVVHNADRPRIRNLDSIPFPAFEKVDLKRYAGYGMMTSRGCPYPCTFCSVAPVWNLQSFSRSPENIVAEMKRLSTEAGVDLFLFQDEFFLSGKKHVMEFCRLLQSSDLKAEWKAFGRINLVDDELMRAMADSGCLELRFGIESGSDRVLDLIKKGFNAAEVLEIIPRAAEIFPRVDAFYIWGFPFETMEDFHQTLFQMVSFRMMGVRILPSLLSLLPQTEIYRDLGQGSRLEFCPYLLPEFVFTGHEVCRGASIEIPERHGDYFGLIRENPDIFPGFFHINLADNVLRKLQLLRQFGFYPEPEPEKASAESCGAHSPRVEPQELATRAS